MYSVQYNGYNLIGVTTVERGDGSYDSTSLFLYINRLLYLGTIHCTQQGLGALLYGSYRSTAKNQSPHMSHILNTLLHMYYKVLIYIFLRHYFHIFNACHIFLIHM